jgi:hypothetical protein
MLLERDLLQVVREELQTRLIVLEEDPAVQLQSMLLINRMDAPRQEGNETRLTVLVEQKAQVRVVFLVEQCALQRVSQEDQTQLVDREDK